MPGVASFVKDNIECYVRNNLTGKNIEFELIPEEISESLAAAFDPQEIRGRSNPIQGYNNSGPRSVEFTVTLHDDYCKDGILNVVNSLKALEYPLYNSYVVPPNCYVRIGKMIRMQAICTGVNVTWKKPYRQGYFINADVSLSFSEVRSNPQDASEVEGGEF